MTKTTIFGILLLLAVGCAMPFGPTLTGAEADQTSANTAFSTKDLLPPPLPPMYSKFSSAVTITQEPGYIRLATQDLPNHRSPYFGVGNPMYEAPYAGMVVNPNLITTQRYVMRVPARPSLAATVTATPMDAIGVAVNGVVLFNQYAAGMTPVSNEAMTFDAHNGHPQNLGAYHYHYEPNAITQNDGKLVGVMMDGFPIYGQKDGNGASPSLDACNGHVGPTPDYPNGIYHYHVTLRPPYLCGGYRGTPGTVTN